MSLIRLLIADTELPWTVGFALPGVADVSLRADFESARRDLLTWSPNLLVTNLRLGAHNGLHLVYLATVTDCATRAIVFSLHDDRSLIREAQGIGAFFEPPDRIVAALPAYISAELPVRDRRSPAQYDRRDSFPGGRRLADAAAIG
jgi:hypothetical protein